MFSVALQTDGCAECGTRLPALHNKFRFEKSEETETKFYYNKLKVIHMLPGTNSIAPPFDIKTTHNPQSAFTESYALAEVGGPWRPTICSRATTKSCFSFHTNHMLASLDFTDSEHWADHSRRWL